MRAPAGARELAGAHPALLAAARPACLDGDTPFAAREGIRKRRAGSPNILLSNPDLMHCTVLPAHKQWADVLAQLRFVVLDEAHVYCGVFGAHVAMVLRRLLRGPWVQALQTNLHHMVITLTVTWRP